MYKENKTGPSVCKFNFKIITIHFQQKAIFNSFTTQVEMLNSSETSTSRIVDSPEKIPGKRDGLLRKRMICCLTPI